MFQGAVSVVIDTGISDEIDATYSAFTDVACEKGHEKKYTKKKEVELTAFERAMKAAKHKMNSPKSQKGWYKKGEKKKLLEKAVGGTSVYHRRGRK